MDKVLLTGASGFLGSIIETSLVQKGMEVLSLNSVGQLLYVNIAEKFSLKPDLRIDIVVHAAGKAHLVPKTDVEKEAFFKVNFEGTKNLCYALENLKTLPKSFIFISTVAVYGIETGVLISENHPLNGITPYAKSKILAENWLKEWAAKHKIRLSIVRLPLIVGPNPPGNLGAMVRGIKSGRYLSIGKGDARKSMVWLEDVAEIIPALSETEGVYNLTDGYHPCFKEIETIISKKLNKKNPLAISIFSAKLLGWCGDLLGSSFPLNSDKLHKITSTLTFDDSKAREKLNWSPSSVLDKMQS